MRTSRSLSRRRPCGRRYSPSWQLARVSSPRATSRVYVFACLLAPGCARLSHSIANSLPGHRISWYHPRPNLRPCLQRLERREEHRRHCLCWHRAGHACLRLHERQVVTQELPPRRYGHHDHLHSPLRRLVRRRLTPRHDRRAHRVPLSCRDRYRRRVSRGQCRGRRGIWRGQVWDEEYVVYYVHKCRH